MKPNFEPTGKLTAKKQYHYICIALAVILPLAIIIITLIKKTFSPVTLLVCAGVAVIMLVIDYSNRSNMVVYNDEQIALLGMFGQPKYYRWDKLSAVYSGDETMRLEFSDGRKLYINLEYDGVNEFIAYLDSVTENQKECR
ncbi:MAG: hypothetical protein ACI4JE_01180 [Ruminococcus sp.]